MGPVSPWVGLRGSVCPQCSCLPCDKWTGPAPCPSWHLRSPEQERLAQGQCENPFLPSPPAQPAMDHADFVFDSSVWFTVDKDSGGQGVIYHLNPNALSVPSPHVLQDGQNLNWPCRVYDLLSGGGRPKILSKERTLPPECPQAFPP